MIKESIANVAIFVSTKPYITPSTAMWYGHTSGLTGSVKNTLKE